MKLIQKFLSSTLAMAFFLSSVEYSTKAAQPDSLEPIVEILSQNQDVGFQLDVLRGLSQAMRGRSKVAMPHGWDAVETKLGQSNNNEVQSLVRSLSLTFGSQNALDALRAILVDTSSSSGDRLNALNSLVQVGDSQLPKTLLSLLKDQAVRADVIRVLARYNQPETPGALLEVYDALSGSEKQSALSVLASRSEYAGPFLVAVEQGQIPKRDLSAAIVRELRNLKNDAVNAKLEVVWGSFRESTADKKAEIERFKRIYYAGGSTPGDATRGRAVYARACQQCHTLFGVGGTVGPDITGSDRRNLDYVLQNIVDPNAVIPNDYRSTEIETKDGRVITGIIKEQTGNALKMVTATETLLIPQDSIESNFQSELSMMPEGLLAPFEDQEIRDLLYYLRQPAQAPLMASKDNVDLFFNGNDLTGWDGDMSLWRVEDGEIVGETKTGLKHNEFLKSEMVLKDFRLIFEVKLTPNSENSGIQFRSQRADHGEVKGYQADAGQGWWGKLYEELGRALLWDKPGDQHVRKDEWNHYEILAVDHHIQTAINGNKCVDLQDPDGALQGIIAFQVHSGGPMEVRFRNFQLEVDPQPKLKTVD